nr:abc transporter a family member 1 [Quercus suber]
MKTMDDGWKDHLKVKKYLEHSWTLTLIRFEKFINATFIMLITKKGVVVNIMPRRNSDYPSFPLGSINFDDFVRAHVGRSNIWWASSGVNLLVRLLMLLVEALLYCAIGLYLDKEQKIKEGLFMMGLNDGIFLLCWFIKYALQK